MSQYYYCKLIKGHIRTRGRKVFEIQSLRGGIITLERKTTDTLFLKDNTVDYIDDRFNVDSLEELIRLYPEELV